jgi:hypothetical protein
LVKLDPLKNGVDSHYFLYNFMRISDVPAKVTENCRKDDSTLCNVLCPFHTLRDVKTRFDGMHVFCKRDLIELLRHLQN